MRASPKTYYGYTGRFRDNTGKNKNFATSVKSAVKIKRKLSECSCTKMIPVADGAFIEHNDIAGNYCNGSGESPNFWKF